MEKKERQREVNQIKKIKKELIRGNDKTDLFFLLIEYSEYRSYMC